MDFPKLVTFPSSVGSHLRLKNDSSILVFGCQVHREALEQTQDEVEDQTLPISCFVLLWPETKAI